MLVGLVCTFDTFGLVTNALFKHACIFNKYIVIKMAAYISNYLVIDAIIIYCLLL
jgi:hypothetical protein